MKFKYGSSALLARLFASVALGVFICAVALSLNSASVAAPNPRLDRNSENLEVDPFVKEIDALIKQGWEDNEVKPSPLATDYEWLRRVYLDIVGHVPPLTMVEKYVEDKDPQKRVKVIKQLLDDPAYVKNWTTIWTNILIGRQTPDRTSRAGMEKFLREAFARNRPWNDITYDILTASGHFEENGAVNFLLAQMTMRDEQVQATAKTTRTFLGVQVQCTQCHNHPFNDWQQNQFWEFNSFLREVRRVDHNKLDASGQRIDDYSELVDGNMDGAVYYEKRNGQMQVAYPKYFGEKVDETSKLTRRQIFGQLIRDDKDKYLARAMVNRMWGHFFGQGFTRPADDMGPHNPASHPKLLERMADEFVKVGYDLKKLVLWITSTEAYALTSQFNADNKVDDPAAGETPLFSHLYLKQMEAEQLYDSLLIATDADKSGKEGYEEIRRQRQMWLQQFVVAFGTDDGEESSTFNGSIPQALMMMNGPLINKAISGDSGSLLNSIVTSGRSPEERIRKLYLASVGRLPTRNELNMSTKLVGSGKDGVSGYQDLFWALLNSNEFIMIH
jgi:hypothetical protein